VSDGPPVPLARLLGMAFRLLIDDLHAALAEQGWDDVRESYGFVLLAVRDQELSTTELASLLGVTKQAASKTLDAMEEGGYIARRDSDRDGRMKIVSLDTRGVDLLRAVEAIYADLEAGWAGTIGETALHQTRTRLERVLRERHDGDLPRLRPA